MIEPAPDGYFVQILVLLSDGRVPGRHPENLPLLHLTHLRLANGANVALLATHQRLTESRRQDLGVSYRHMMFSAADPDAFGGLARLLLHGHRDDGTRFATELNAERPDPDPLLVF